jgi:hypothetical protein
LAEDINLSGDSRPQAPSRAAANKKIAARAGSDSREAIIIFQFLAFRVPHA